MESEEARNLGESSYNSRNFATIFRSRPLDGERGEIWTVLTV